jgi:hypothetical protein
MEYRLELIESDKIIGDLILKNLLPMVNKKFDKAITNTIRLINLALENSLRNQPEYTSLKSPNGKLRLEFGIPNTSIVDNVINAIIDTVFVNRKDPRISNGQIIGGFTLGFAPNNALIDIADNFSVITEKGQELPWLKWLLFEGTAPIIKDYDIQIKPGLRSRTGLGALMVKTNGAWRVPTEFAGTYSNNWITRAIDNIDDSIEEIIRKNIED